MRLLGFHVEYDKLIRNYTQRFQVEIIDIISKQRKCSKEGRIKCCLEVK